MASSSRSRRLFEISTWQRRGAGGGLALLLVTLVVGCTDGGGAAAGASAPDDSTPTPGSDAEGRSDVDAAIEPASPAGACALVPGNYLLFNTAITPALPRGSYAAGALDSMAKCLPEDALIQVHAGAPAVDPCASDAPELISACKVTTAEVDGSCVVTFDKTVDEARGRPGGGPTMMFVTHAVRTFRPDRTGYVEETTTTLSSTMPASTSTCSYRTETYERDTLKGPRESGPQPAQLRLYNRHPGPARKLCVSDRDPSRPMRELLSDAGVPYMALSRAVPWELGTFGVTSVPIDRACPKGGADVALTDAQPVYIGDVLSSPFRPSKPSKIFRFATGLDNARLGKLVGEDFVVQYVVEGNSGYGFSANNTDEARSGATELVRRQDGTDVVRLDGVPADLARYAMFLYGDGATEPHRLVFCDEEAPPVGDLAVCIKSP